MSDHAGAAELRVYRFGDCELNLDRRELRRGGASVDLQPKALDLLAYLIAHRDRAVDKDELQAAIWPNVVVTEASLTKAVQRARIAVGDDSDRQTVIGTVHSHGYRFVARLLDADPDVGAEPARAELTQEIPAPALRSWPLWVAAAALALAIGYGSFRYGAETTQQKPLRVAVLPVENGTGNPELDWTRLGLMSVIADGLRKSNLLVVDDHDIVRLTGARPGGRAAPTAEWLAQTLRQVHGADYLLSARLERQGDVYRMHSTLSREKGEADAALFAGSDLLQLARNAADRAVASTQDARPGPPIAGAISDDSRVNQSYAQGRALDLEGRCNEAQALFRAAIVQQPQLLEPRIAYGSCAQKLGDTESAGRMFREVLQELDKRDVEMPATRHLKATALLRLGILLNRTGRLAESDAAYLEAEKLARGLSDLDLTAIILVNRAFIAEDRSQFQLAREHIMRALGLFQDARRSVIPGNLYAALANIDMEQGKLNDADRNYARAIETFRRVGDRRNEAMILNNQGLLKREQGHYEDAETLHRASREIREELGDRQGLGRVEDMLGLVHLGRGEFDAAMPRLETALAIAREGDDRFFEAATLGHLGEAHLGSGRLDESQRDLAQAVKIFQGLGNRAYVLQLSVKLADIERQRGRLAAAERLAAKVLQEARAEHQSLAEIDALELHASIAADQGDHAARARWLRDALNRAREIGHSGKATSLSIQLALAYLVQSDTVAAEPLIGTLIEAPESFDLMRLRAAWAFARNDSLAATQAMQRARQLAGQRWSEADAAALARYQHAS